MAFKAHDVRHLKICPSCHSIGDRREMAFDSSHYYHGRCFEADFGLDALLALPRSVRENLTLGDVGIETMGILVDAAHEEDARPMTQLAPRREAHTLTFRSGGDPARMPALYYEGERIAWWPVTHPATEENANIVWRAFLEKGEVLSRTEVSAAIAAMRGL